MKSTQSFPDSGKKALCEFLIKIKRIKLLLRKLVKQTISFFYTYIKVLFVFLQKTVKLEITDQVSRNLTDLFA